MFVSACKKPESWTLTNGWGHKFELPSGRDYAHAELPIGVLGTGRRAEIPGAPNKAKLLASMLAALNRPIYLLDVRRDGVGGMGSWGPREFASIVPEMIAGRSPYAYLHLPCLAPSIRLLDESRKSGPAAKWELFRERYITELSEQALDVARAFVAGAAAADGLAIFLCAEADQPGFDSLSGSDKDSHYCHRYTLAACIARRAKAMYQGLTVRRIHLDVVDFHACGKRPGSYRPRETLL